MEDVFEQVWLDGQYNAAQAVGAGVGIGDFLRHVYQFGFVVHAGVDDVERETTPLGPPILGIEMGG